MEQVNSVKKSKQFNILSNFSLKLLAMLFMTLDHIGLLLSENADFFGFVTNSPVLIMCDVFRILGRLAFPLFAFLLVEGIRHTHSNKKYFLRLGFMALLISIAYIVIIYGLQMNTPGGNIFFDLLLAGLAIYLIEKKKWISLLALLPFAYALFCTFVNAFEHVGVIHWSRYFPYFLRLQYDIFGFALILTFYFAYKLIPIMFKTETFKNLDFDAYKTTNEYRLFANGMIIAALLVINLVWYFLSYYIVGLQYLMGLGVESWSIFASIFILLYNGKRGYNAKWFYYGAYAYYPMHILIIGGIIYAIIMLT